MSRFSKPTVRNLASMAVACTVAICTTTTLASAATTPAPCEGQWAEGFHLPGLDGPVFASVVFNDGSGDALYVGGEFTIAGETLASNIAKWDGLNWLALGTGMNNWVGALAVFDDGDGPALYAGGAFTTAGDVKVNHIAKWDGNNWSALGTGLNGAVIVLAFVDDSDLSVLYAGGRFTTAGGIDANYIATWDGSKWSPLGTGMNSEVRALSVFDDGSGKALYAGGWFTTAGGKDANHFAVWSGSEWSDLDAEFDNPVWALTVFDDGGGAALYATGRFTSVGGINANLIAKWNGSSWSALGMGLGGVFPEAITLAVFDDGSARALYVGGIFTTAGAVSANFVAKWDGVEWSALGTGMGGRFPFVFTLSSFDDGSGPALYVGGNFTIAGGIESNYIAKWQVICPEDCSTEQCGDECCTDDESKSTCPSDCFDFRDVADFWTCFTGPDVDAVPDCQMFDLDGDEDVDLDDYAVFARYRLGRP